MKKVKVGKYWATVSDRDYELVSQYTWRPYKGGDPGANGTYYAIAHEHGRKFGEKDVSVIMHRLILNAPKGIKVDHRDGDGLNNQRGNLRLATNKQNSMNQKPHVNTSSPYKGVSLDKRHGTWKAYIISDGKSIWLGQHKSEEEAARAYDVAARKLFGEFAKCNFSNP
jgi:hypothetical protein